MNRLGIIVLVCWLQIIGSSAVFVFSRLHDEMPVATARQLFERFAALVFLPYTLWRLAR